MGFEGFVLLGVAVLVIAVVMPTLMRHRFVAAHTPLGDRYADDLRMLRVGDAPKSVVSDGGETRGSVFFRRPEVEMARESVVNVRQLARDRARLRATMSERAARLQRGFWGACALGVVTILAWVAVAVTSLALYVPLTVMGATALYVGFFVHMVVNEGKADDADRAELRRIEEQLGPRRVKRRAPRGESGDNTTSRPSRFTAGTARMSAPGRRARGRTGGERKSRPESVVLRGQAGEAEANVPRGKSTPQERPSDTRGSFEKSADNIRSAQGVVQRGEVTSRKVSDTSQGTTKTTQRSAVSDSSAEYAGSRTKLQPAQAGQQVGARASLPSYTLKPRGFGRRVVDPYVAPATPTAEVPYRPQKPGEVYDASTGAVTAHGHVGTASDEKAASASLLARGAVESSRMSGGYAREMARSEVAVGHGADMDDKAIAEGSEPRTVGMRASVDGVVDSGETLSGGSVLDELLERRRA